MAFPVSKSTDYRRRKRKIRGAYGRVNPNSCSQLQDLSIGAESTSPPVEQILQTNDQKECVAFTSRLPMLPTHCVPELNTFNTPSSDTKAPNVPNEANLCSQNTHQIATFHAHDANCLKYQPMVSSDNPDENDLTYTYQSTSEDTSCSDNEEENEKKRKVSSDNPDKYDLTYTYQSTSEDTSCSDNEEENEMKRKVEERQSSLSSLEEWSDDDNCDSDSSLNFDSFQVAFLEEEPESDVDDPGYAVEEGGVDIHGDNMPLIPEDPHVSDSDRSSNPDSPPSSSSDSDASSSSSDSDASSSSSDSDDDPMLHFANEALNRAVFFNRHRTVREKLLVYLALAAANNWTFKSLIESLKSENVLLGVKLFPTYIKGLWKVLSNNGQGMSKYAYCKGCGRYFGLYDGLPDVKRCRTCGLITPKKKIKWFLSVSIKRQLLRLVSIPDIAQHLLYRNNRIKINPEAYEDIFDGSAFKDLQANNGVLASPYNFSYIFETDGLRLGKAARTDCWALLLRIADLPPNIRQRHMILAAVWVDNEPLTPYMNTFLKPFVRQANQLSQEGFTWKPDGINEVTSKFIPLCMCVDYKARFPMLNMVQYNGHFGCFLCDHRGVYAGGSMRYPSLPHPQVPPFNLRTDENVAADMEAAHNGDGQPVRGFRGFSILLRLQHFLIARGNAIDNLHAIFERVVPPHTERLLRLGTMPMAEKVRRINDRFLRAKPPTKISRTPYDFGKRGSYKASEWRNWLLHYSVPCLEGLRIPARYLNHWQMLSYATFLLTQDSITPQEVLTAERLFLRYVELYEEYFGVESVSPCFHLMTHLAGVVRLWGPLSCYSMFNFESYNQKVLAKVSSPKGAITQIVTRHLMRQEVVTAMYHQEGLANEVRDCIIDIMSKDRRSNVTEIDGVYLLGTGTVRLPQPEEIESLRLEGFLCDNLKEFERVIVDSCEYHSTRVNPDRLHDNTVVSSKRNTFCIIHSIVIVTRQGQEDFCGMFVTELDVVLFPEARHIGRIRQEGNLPHFMRISAVRCPAVKHEVRGQTYVSSLPNGIEID